MLSNSTIRKEVTKQHNSFSQGLKKTVCPQSRLDRPNQSHPHAKTSAPPSLHATNNANKAINAKITNVCNAYSQSPTDVPTLKSISSSDQQPSLRVSSSRNLFYDHLVDDPHNWEELQNRLLPTKLVFRIVSIYAFHAHGIHKLQTIRSQTNSNIRKYKCSTCPDGSWNWSVTICRSPDSPDHWQVRPVYFVGNHKHSSTKLKNSVPTTQCRCNCQTHTKDRLSDQLFFNIRYVRETVSQNYWKATAYIDEKIVDHFKTCGIQPNKLPSLAHRKQAIAKLLDLEINKMRQRYHQMPQFFKQLSLDDPRMSVALQNDHNNHFY